MGPSRLTPIWTIVRDFPIDGYHEPSSFEGTLHQKEGTWKTRMTGGMVPEVRTIDPYQFRDMRDARCEAHEESVVMAVHVSVTEFD